MSRWFLAFLALACALVPVGPVRAQQSNNCGPLLMQAVAPILRLANRYYPGGVFPYGYAPLTQPFVPNPAEYTLYGYPQQGYLSGYAAPPLLGALGALVAPVDANPRLSAQAVLDELQRDGTWDRLSTLERAEWLFRLASLQRDEFMERIAVANLQREAQRDLVTIRRTPYDLAQAYQDRARTWHDSYVLAAQVTLNLLQAACNPATGTVPGLIGPVPLDLVNLALLCRAPNFFSLCAGFR
jgi:hypothetical protein